MEADGGIGFQSAGDSSRQRPLANDDLQRLKPGRLGLDERVCQVVPDLSRGLTCRADAKMSQEFRVVNDRLIGVTNGRQQPAG